MFKSNKPSNNVRSARRAGDLCKLEWQRTDGEWTLLVTDVSSDIVLVQQQTNFPNAIELIKTVRMAFSRFGPPNSIATDHGFEFTSEQFRDLLASSGVNHVLGSPAQLYLAGANRSRRTRI
jgi:transposase InsO family protein